MEGIFLNSLKVGVLSSAICTIFCLVWLLSLGVIKEFNSTKIASYFEKLFFFSICAPLIVIHPAIITSIFFGVWSSNAFNISVLDDLSVNDLGVVFVSVVLYLPFVYLRFKQLSIENYFYLWRKSIVVNRYPIAKGLVIFVLAPLLKEVVSIFLVFSILIQGIVFVPQMHQGGVTTIGSELYVAVTRIAYEDEYAATLIYLLLGLAAFYILIEIFMSHFDLRSKIVSFLVRRRFFFFDSAKEGKAEVRAHSCLAMMLLAIMFVAMLTVMIFIVGHLSSVVFDKALSGLDWVLFLNKEVSGAVRASLGVVLPSVVASFLVFMLVIFFSGYKDVWVRSKCTNFSVAFFSIIAAFPFAIICSLFSNYFETHTTYILVFILTLYGTSMAVLITGDRFIFRLFNLEKKRRCISMPLERFWFRPNPANSILFPEVVLVVSVILVLLWNDMTIQLFATSKLNGFAKLLVALGRDGLDVSQARDVIAVEALIFLSCLLFFAFSLMCRRRLSP